MNRALTGEVAKKKGRPAAEQFERRMLTLPICYITPEGSDILAAARIKSEHNVSYADCFAISLALNLNPPLVTGDPEILALRNMVTVGQLG